MSQSPRAVIMRALWCCLALAGLFFTGSISIAEEPATPASTTPKETTKPRIEVVFVLDTTGSMGGLIQAAKEKIWAIANTLATAKPAPEIKMGLVAYRDHGDQYVTTMTKLTDDIDAVYATLMSFRAEGGGDGPESVNQALNEAITKMTWSTDKNIYRVVYLVGDFPPHMDYQDDVKYPDTCKKAAELGITINTIQCGNEGSTTPIWNEIAKLAEGQYFQVDQSGSAIVTTSPYDEKLAALAKKLDETRIYYGTLEERNSNIARSKDAAKIYDGATMNAQAQRAYFNSSDAGLRNFAYAQELVMDIQNKKVTLATLDVKLLPDNMQKMSQAEREKYIADQLKNRQALQDEIRDLGTKRQTYLLAEMKKLGDKTKSSLDMLLFKSIQSQAAKANITYDDKAMSL